MPNTIPDAAAFLSSAHRRSAERKAAQKKTGKKGLSARGLLARVAVVLAVMLVLIGGANALIMAAFD